MGVQHPVGMPLGEKRVAVARRPGRRKPRDKILHLFARHVVAPELM
jgi:hypothetical protein